jgi:hypothetical protein
VDVGFCVDRVAGGDRHYCQSCALLLPVLGRAKEKWTVDLLHEQYEAVDDSPS